MHKILTLLFVFLSLNVFGQNDTIKYEIMNKEKNYILFLYPDNAFQFNDVSGSCRTWYSFDGIWKKENQKLILIDSIEVMEHELKISEKSNHTDFILINVKNEENKPLKGVFISFSPIEPNKKYKTNRKGQVEIQKSVLKNMFKNDADVEMYYHNKNIPAQILSYFKSNADQIDITDTENLKTKNIVRKTFFNIKNDEIYFDTQQYSYKVWNFWIDSWGNFKQITK